MELLYLLPIISMAIGWATNKVAIYMLFKPKEKIWIIQGIIPKKKAEIAKRIGVIVSEELISIKDILGKIDKEASIGMIKTTLRDRIGSFSVAAFIPDNMLTDVVNMITFEILDSLNNMDSSSIDNVIDIAKMVEDKVNAFDNDKLESIVRDVAQKEFVAIEWSGAILGLIIGCLQLALVLL